eukprot:gene805-biopygen681
MTCASAPCNPLVICIPTPDGRTCGACPAGYAGDGVVCEDVDECSEAGRGGCDPLADCVNTAGGHACGRCPEGYLGSGSTRCLPSLSCEEDNGGCDLLTVCSAVSGGEACGACPPGYTGNGATGCVDEDGCAAEGADCYGVCVDAQAPEVGYTCAACPPGMVGDGAACMEDECFVDNGGCDTAVTCTMDIALGEPFCGECPTGQAAVEDELLSSGWRCAEIDGCKEAPCWSNGELSQPCEDVVAPGTGRVCGSCPGGFFASSSGVSCVDVDECEGEGNGGCWVSSEDAELRAECVNKAGTYVCGACPEGFIGTGERGCRARVLCDMNHGNCDPLSLCTDNTTTGYADCGACPQGYSGTGDTACVDTDGCAQEPCFPGVACEDVPAPGEGRTCGSCPEGYWGTGESCEMCALQLGLDLQKSTVVNSTMKRSVVNQLAGVFRGLSHPGCVQTQGVEYRWDGVRSDAVAVPLDSATNKRETRTLYFPTRTLTTDVAYSMRLTATLAGNRQVSATAKVSFVVRGQGLVTLIQGGPVKTGEGQLLLLDAGHSYDPDGKPGELMYTWTCTRTDKWRTEAHCRDIEGSLLPPRMTSAALNLTLQGDVEAGAEYTFTCQVRKAERQSSASTTATIVKGSPPVPSIAPLLQRPSSNAILRLTSSVTSLWEESLTLVWSVEPASTTTLPVDLCSVASTPLNTLNLGLRAGALSPGGTYLFTLTAKDAHGPSSVALEVRVNSAPHSGVMVVGPSEGLILETVFAVEALDWEDGVDDKLLWYQLQFEVVGGVAEQRTLLSEWQPSPAFAQQMTAAGRAELDWQVTLYLYVKNVLGASTHAAQNVSVKPMAFSSEDGQDAYVDDALERAWEGLRMGDDTSSSIQGLASLLGQGSGNATSQRRNVLTDEAEHRALASDVRLRQREEMLEMASTAWNLLPASTDSMARIAQVRQRRKGLTTAHTLCRVG